MAKTNADSGEAAQAYYEKTPTSARGEFDHADAVVADLNAPSFSEMVQSGVQKAGDVE